MNQEKAGDRRVGKLVGAVAIDGGLVVGCSAERKPFGLGRTPQPAESVDRVEQSR